MITNLENLIYNSNTERDAVHQKAAAVAAFYHPNKSEPDLSLTLEYRAIKDATESNMLFELLRKTYADELWAGPAWKEDKCEEVCPFGEFCHKRLITIDGTSYCIGQLKYKGITASDICKKVMDGSAVSTCDSEEYIGPPIYKLFDEADNYISMLGRQVPETGKQVGQRYVNLLIEKTIIQM